MSDILKTLSNAFADAADHLSPSIVRMETRRRMPATGLVWSADGVIVTSNHVVERDEDLHIGLADGKVVPATLIGRDPSSDLALLRAEATGLTPTPWAGVESIRVGQLVVALGRPSKNLMASLGVVSAFGEGVRGRGVQLDHFLQTDVTMYPGFSGGPLVSAEGSVLGINTSALMQDSSFTISTSTIKRVAETLLQHGKMRRGYMGVGSQVVKLPSQLATVAGQEAGLLLVTVEAASPAEKGGLLLGDTLVALNGKPLRTAEALAEALTGDLIGKPATVKILRGGQLTEVTVIIGEHS
jgi:S1-C subfamily serine protease